MDSLPLYQEKLNIITLASEELDSKLILKVLRELPPLRKGLNKDLLVNLITTYYNPADFQRQYLLESLKRQSDKENTKELNPEVDLFIHLLTQLYLHDANKLVILNKLNGKIVELLRSYSKRSLDFLQAKIWFYILRTNELLDASKGTNEHLISLRPVLLKNLRTATLKHDQETTASIITLLLRNYIITNDINAVINFVSKVDFPENCGNSLYARYYYYQSRIETIGLNYSAALSYIIVAIRKAPQSKYIKGFLVNAQKLKIIIELLMGDIPDLRIFTDPSYEKSLNPYMELTKAVRLGDLNLFNDILNKFEAQYVKDKNYNLILRLRKNVIKTGIRLISLCYKKISIKDICIKLKMDSEISTEYILNKLIKDHIIEANLDNENLKSKDFTNIYDSEQPSLEFDRRIKTINAIKSSFVKEMIYPENKSRFNSKDIQQYEQDLELIRVSEDDFDELF